MTLSIINERVTAIKAKINRDNEAAHAHALEDELLKEFVTYIMETTCDKELYEKAKLVMSVDKIDFDRHCA